MIEYLTLIFVFLHLHKRLKLYLIKRNNKKYRKIAKGAEQFLIKKGKTGILCLHGFSSSAWDYRDFGKYLASKNYTVYAPLIAGHGTTPEHLAATTKKDWILSAEKALLDLKKQCRKIIIIGDSFGGNLAILLAAKHKVDGIVVMGMPLFFKHEKLARMIFLLIRHFKVFKKKWYHSILDKETIKNRKTYQKVPLNCVRDVEKVIKLSGKRLKNVTAPILIMQSTTDFGVDNQTPEYIYSYVGSEKKEIIWVKNAYHVFIIDRNREDYFRQIYDFLKKIKN